VAAGLDLPAAASACPAIAAAEPDGRKTPAVFIRGPKRKKIQSRGDHDELEEIARSIEKAQSRGR
jgi:hypothetical protein